ncbi:hypothetical protein NDU88_005643 [Pleurodeles waltl]|uniref:Uncharacterized protein n=1 Tax=Pleurodeles waltl TaxID=8319 RepID=A0AAV7PJH2_PLEWA|nr:hypothetical protein NDU88_005643 [Pleurodeles waltl]
MNRKLDALVLRSDCCAPRFAVEFPETFRSLCCIVSTWSRLSNTPAQDPSDWRYLCGIHKGDDGLTRFRDNKNRSTLENPDVRVLAETKREDRLKGGDGGGRGRGRQRGERRKPRRPRGTRGRRLETREQRGLRGVGEQGRKDETGDALTARHAPGGTWLMKERSFLKDSLKLNREGNDRKGEGRDSAGRGGGEAGRGQRGDKED